MYFTHVLLHTNSGDFRVVEYSGHTHELITYESDDGISYASFFNRLNGYTPEYGIRNVITFDEIGGYRLLDNTISCNGGRIRVRQLARSEDRVSEYLIQRYDDLGMIDENVIAIRSPIDSAPICAICVCRNLDLDRYSIEVVLCDQPKPPGTAIPTIDFGSGKLAALETNRTSDGPDWYVMDTMSERDDRLARAFLGLSTGYSIIYETNGGSEIEPMYYQFSLPSVLPTPYKSGCGFEGWFLDSSLETPAVPGASISSNTVLYAKWNSLESDNILPPNLGIPSVLQTGFVTMWEPTIDEVRDLSEFLWTTNLFDNLRKLFNDPMEALLFLGIIPFDVNTAERSNVYFGNLDTEVQSTPIVQQYYMLNFGDIEIPQYYHSFLDYEPNATAEIFLPFCGSFKLSMNEIMGSTISLRYNVDVFTGSCVAMITVRKPGLQSVLYSFEGNLMATMPVTGKNYSEHIRAMIAVIGGAALKAVTAI